MVLRFCLLFFSFLFFQNTAVAQKPPENDAEFEKKYKYRVRQERLYGVYIPKDLTEAFVELSRKIDDDNKAILKQMTEEEVERKLYFSLGRWVVHNWGFYGGSRLSDYIKKQFDIHHPERMAAFIIVAYHRSLRRVPLDIKGLVEEFHARRDAERKKELEKGEVIFEETRKREGGGN